MRFEALTFPRFIAAAVVVLFHFGREPLGLTGFLVAGPEMVTFFFVLSGFVMGVSTFNRSVDKAFYWWSRAARILPMYWIAIAIMVAVDRLQGVPIEYTPLLLNLTLLQAWFPQHALTVNPPGWSLSVEAFFYLTFPFLMDHIRKRLASARMFLVSALVLWLLTQVVLTAVFEQGLYGGFPSVSHSLVYYFPVSHYCSFALGVAGSQVVMDRQRLLSSNWGSMLALGCASFLVLALINNEPGISAHAHLQFAYGSSFLAPVFLLLIVAIAVSTPAVSRALSSRVLVLLGESSFSLYILQHPVYRIVDIFVGKRLDLAPAPYFLVYFMLLIAVSVVSFVCLERPVNKFMRRLFLNSFRTSKAGRIAA